MFHEGMWGGMWFGWIFWIVIIGVIVWLVINNQKKNQQNLPPKEESAMDILKKRYAKGEISKEEFERMKKDIE